MDSSISGSLWEDWPIEYWQSLLAYSLTRHVTHYTHSCSYEHNSSMFARAGLSSSCTYSMLWKSWKTWCNLQTWLFYATSSIAYVYTRAASSLFVYSYLLPFHLIFSNIPFALGFWFDAILRTAGTAFMFTSVFLYLKNSNIISYNEK